MSAIPQPNTSRVISERILNPLREVARRQWSVLAAAGVIKTLLVSLSVIFVAALAMGLFQNIPMPVRIVAAVLVWGTVLWAAMRFLRPALRRRSLVGTAMDVEAQLAKRRGRDTQERITSSLELGAERNAAFAGSPSLVQHLMRQAEADAAAIKPEAVVPTGAVIRLGLVLLPLLGLWITLAAILPPQRLLRPIFHLLMPWRETPAFLADLVVAPGDVTLAQGDALQIDVTANARTSNERDMPVKKATITTRDPGSKTPTTLDLARTGPRTFQYAAADLQKSFEYRVRTDVGESRWYTATVNPRPAVELVEVRYAYPSYMGLDARIDANKDDGAVDAFAGTRVTIAVRTPTALREDGASKIVVTEGREGAKSAPKEYPLTRAADGLHAAMFVATADGEYTINLLNSHGLANKDNHARAITVRPDARPVIDIISPKAEVKARPTDSVPVAFGASDDFGIATIEAMVQVDGGPARAYPVKPVGRDRRALNDTHPLSIAAALSDAALPDAERLTYWLRATDARDPDPQSAESARQTVVINRSADGLAQQLDKQRAKDFLDDIRAAIRQLGENFHYPDSIRPVGDPVLPARFLDRAQEGKEKLEATANQLTIAANEHLDDPFAPMAEKAKAIASGPILGSADALARVELHREQVAARREDTESSIKQIADARRRLEELLKEVEQQAKAIEAAHKLEELAKDQAKVAEAMKAQSDKPKSDKPKSDKPKAEEQSEEKQKNQQEQQKLAQKTQQLIGENPTLQNPEARQQAEQLQQLVRKVEELQARQQQQEQATQRLAEMNAAKEQAAALAEKQEALNEKVAAFRKEDKAALEQSNAPPPPAQQLEDIVNTLNANRLEQAAQQQKQAAQQLEQAAQKLEQQAKADAPQLNAAEQAQMKQEAAEAQAAQAAADQAKQGAEQAKQAARQTDDAQKAAEQAGDKAEKAAQAKGENAEQQKKDAAQQAAQAAEQAARAAQAAAEQAKQAAARSEKTEAQAEAAAKDASAETKKDAAKAEAAADAAQAAAAEAQESAKDAQAAAKDAQAAAQQGNAERAGEQAEKAGREAKEAGEKAAEASAKAAEAAQALAQAEKADAAQAQAMAGEGAKEQAKAAAAEARGLAAEQQALAKSAAEAAKASQGQAAPPEQIKAAQKDAAQQQQALAESVGRAKATAEKLEAKAAEAGDAGVAERADAAQSQFAEAATEQKAAAEAQAAGETAKAAAAQKSASEALAKAESALRGEQPAAAAEAGKPTGEKGEVAQGDAAKGDPAKGEGAQASGEKGDPAAGESPAGEPGEGEPGQGAPAQASSSPPPATPAEAMRQAAAAAQEAAQAQQQAASGSPSAPAAAAQAAQALAKASQAMAQAMQPGQKPGQPGQTPGEPSPSPSQASAPTPSPVAGQTDDSKGGIAAQLEGGSNERPPAISALGISASDWARLGPLDQRELLNAAQQGGPPQYQSMIKNYYVRIARMQAQGAER